MKHVGLHLRCHPVIPNRILLQGRRMFRAPYPTLMASIEQKGGSSLLEAPRLSPCAFLLMCLGVGRVNGSQHATCSAHSDSGHTVIPHEFPSAFYLTAVMTRRAEVDLIPVLRDMHVSSTTCHSLAGCTPLTPVGEHALGTIDLGTGATKPSCSTLWYRV